jgi:hypothetical protein
VVIKTLRDGLARLVSNERQSEALKADAVARALLERSIRRHDSARASTPVIFCD